MKCPECGNEKYEEKKRMKPMCFDEMTTYVPVPDDTYKAGYRMEALRECKSCTYFDHEKKNLEKQCPVALSLYTAHGVSFGTGFCSEYLDDNTNMNCPRCEKKMVRYLGAFGSEIIDYECESCGVWVEEVVKHGRK